MDSWILAALVVELLYLTVSALASTSHSASEAPAFFAAFSILFLHMPQLPETGIDSVFAFCANEMAVKAIDIVNNEIALNVFMIVQYKS